MTFGGTDSLQTRIEQALAFGRSDTYITARLGVDAAEIQRVRDWLEEVAAHDDGQANWDEGRCRKGLHEMTPDNQVATNRGGTTCRKCKNEANRINEKKRRARGRAA